MEKGLVLMILVGFGIVMLSVLGYIIKTRNYFRVQKEEIDNMLSRIEVSLTERYDTLVKLNATVKGYADHESSVLANVTRMRKGMTGEELSKVNGELSAAQTNINALVENYPDLKANINFLHLQETIVDLEKDLEATRRIYNREVKEYNSKAVRFPSSMIATSMGVVRESYFEAEEHKRNDVELKF